jgi:hypothetical protein
MGKHKCSSPFLLNPAKATNAMEEYDMENKGEKKFSKIWLQWIPKSNHYNPTVREPEFLVSPHKFPNPDLSGEGVLKFPVSKTKRNVKTKTS